MAEFCKTCQISYFGLFHTNKMFCIYKRYHTIRSYESHDDAFSQSAPTKSADVWSWLIKI